MRVRIEGRRPLNGVYRPAGNPNAAQALIAAALLTESVVTLRNLPHARSSDAMLEAAAGLGAAINQHDADRVTIQAAQVARRVLSHTETDTAVSAILLVAPLLIRRQYARLELDFPLNRIRTHLEALRDLGIDMVTDGSAVEFRHASWERKSIILTQASVTATALVMMLAARLGRETLIHNAACEPHIEQLAETLNLMGARIEGVGSNLLRIYGVSELGGADVTLRPNHIEAGSVAAIAAMSGGRVQIEGVRLSDMGIIGKIFWRLGIQLDIDDAGIFIPRHESLSVSNREEDVDSSIETAPWPGFPSDLVAVATVLATQARGTSLIHEKMFNNRLLFVDKLKAMGAQIVLCDPHRAIVVGATPLRAAYLDSPDVRAGLGLIAAALVADGVSTIDNAQAVEHTFAGALHKLQALNAGIEFV
jgi:UDP-N-acetylglucosamine 1-carboxyvinyltransferase